jgi:hypothetical protein
MPETRTWEATDAVRSATPLLVGLMGPSGGGKTFSALRLATGMQTVTGGDIFGIDTESRRMLHYADRFKFKHVEFRAPFSSDAYAEVLTWAVREKGAKIVIVDSMSHEHEGEDGYLEFHDKELERLAGANATDVQRDKRNMQAWIKPSAARQRLIRRILHLDANFIFTFRAKEKVKPEGGKIVEQGFCPIAGDAFLYEMTVCGLLMPAAMGVPTWQSAMPGEKQMIKPAEQFTRLFDGYGLTRKPLSEEHGRGLALWAKGEGPVTPDTAQNGAEDRSRTESGVDGQPDADMGDPGWDHIAWAGNFELMFGEVKTVADLDALWSDPSNATLFAYLRKREEPVARRVHAAMNGRRKALRDQARSQEEF